MKSHYDTAIDDWISSHPGQTVATYHVAGLFKTAFERAATLEKATKGFMATGIFPLNKNIFSDDDFLPSEVTEQEEENEDIDLEDENNRFINFDGPEAHDPDDPPDVGAEAMNQDEIHPLTMEENHTSGIEVDNISAINLENTVESPIAVLSKSPVDIIPLPRIKVTSKRTRSRRLESTLLTSTPNRKRLENEEDEKSKKIRTKTGPPKTLFSKLKRKMLRRNNK